VSQRFVRLSVCVIALFFPVVASFALVVNTRPTRFDRALLPDPSAQVGVLAESPESISGFDAERQGWIAFAADHGGAWQVHVDRRSGAPLLVTGPGIRWFAPDGAVPSIPALEATARAFLAANETLFKVAGAQLALNRAGSAVVDKDHVILLFDRVVDGLHVEGNRVVLHVVRGNLVSFGADHWGALDHAPAAKIDMATARQVLYTTMGLTGNDRISDLSAPALVVSPRPIGADDVGRYQGAPGLGNAYRSVWKFALSVGGTTGSWVGKVDATTGAVIALYDDNKYGQVKGGVFPRSNDGICPDGCEQPNFPFPYANVTIGGTPQTAGDMGQFDCSPAGGNASTALTGPYISISDTCGVFSEGVTCDDDVNLGVAPAANTNCGIQPGRSVGDTAASRTGYYHPSRIKEKLRYWLPSDTWAASPTTVNLDLFSTCNAFWDNVSLNMYREGGGCRNDGEIAAVLNHELGHGIDQNDGGGYDDPTEAYADITALVQDHHSCIGRGFFESGVCSGYGDSCLSCTGIRDQDWDQHVSHAPATPSGFATTNCGGGDGPCGREQHCESYIAGETIYDLAKRDLPAAGFDAATSWQITERLWYKSRQGSGGNAYNCSLPSSDGCNAGGWYNTMRIADDDDGNLANGTPHAAAIFAAFNRHGIACGAATDASNKNSSVCPSLVQPVMTATAGSNSISLSWAAVPNAVNYLILRNDIECDYSSNVIATVPAPTTSYVDTDVPNDFPINYRVQAQGSNVACNSPVSSCQTAQAQPFAGSIKLGQATYACSSGIQVSVRDANIGAPTTTATISSNTEPTPETVVLTETPPGSSKYVGTIPADSGPAVAGNGILSMSNGDTITAQYIDADDGQGGHNVPRLTTAAADCVPPAISQVAASGISDVQATVTWATNESSSSTLHYGPAKPPAQTASTPGLATAHNVPITGLQACTVYWYSVESQDAAGNDVTDANGSAYYHFETLGDLGSGLQSCHGGKVTINKSTVNCADTLSIKVTDLDLNLSPSVVDTVPVTVTSSTETIPETITLTETGPNTSQFTGTIVTQTGAPVADGKLEVQNGDIVSVAYRDANDGTGAPAVSTVSANVDCAGAGSTLVEVISISDEGAQIHWTTSEPTTGRVDWGPTAALGNVANYPVLATDHVVTLTHLAECGGGFFRITTTDAYGNQSVLDKNGSPYSFAAWRIPPGIFKDTFETNTGWVLQGDWEIGAPQGKGTPPADPTSAFEGTKVLGQDLSGTGAHPGDYEPNTNLTATTPVINATSLVNGQIRFRRKLSTGDGANTTVTVLRNGVNFNVWSSTFESDGDWTLQTINLSPYADGTSNLKIVFRENAGPSVSHSGWNIDRVIVNSANQPPFEACGGCGAAPAFTGLASAKDANPCGDTGITLTWNSAAAWGSGSTGTYIVYRDTTPNFVPSAANRIAIGVSGSSYTDATAPNGVTLYYLVRAENNETCSTGPKNGGVVDANAVYRSAQDQTSQPAAGAVGGTLRVADINLDQVRLTWSAAANAASYHVYRGPGSHGSFTQIANVSGTLFEDRDQIQTPNSWYYVVKAADACGNEEP
jgi:hypothetical protein